MLTSRVAAAAGSRALRSKTHLAGTRLLPSLNRWPASHRRAHITLYQDPHETVSVSLRLTRLLW